MSLLSSEAQRATRAHGRRMHAERLDGVREPDLAEPELAAAWRALALHWLREYPHYRAEIQRRVVAAQLAFDGPDARCVECGGDLRPGRYTEGCEACSWRRQKRAKRAEQARREQRLTDLIGY